MNKLNKFVEMYYNEQYFKKERDVNYKEAFIPRVGKLNRSIVHKHIRPLCKDKNVLTCNNNNVLPNICGLLFPFL